MLTIFAVMLFYPLKLPVVMGILRVLQNNGQNVKRTRYECGIFGDLRRYRCGAAFLITPPFAFF